MTTNHMKSTVEQDSLSTDRSAHPKYQKTFAYLHRLHQVLLQREGDLFRVINQAHAGAVCLDDYFECCSLGLCQPCLHTVLFRNSKSSKDVEYAIEKIINQHSW